MAEVVRMPRLSDTMEEGNIVGWQKSVGDEIEPGDVLAEVETDKATMEIESYVEGTLLHITVDEGPVPVNSIIAVVGEEGEDYNSLLEDAQDSTEEKESQSSSTSEKENNPVDSGGQDESSSQKDENQKEESTENDTSSDSSRIKASPLAKAMAKEKGIDISSVKGSGDGGRIIKSDIETYKPESSVTKSKDQRSSETEYEDSSVSQMRKIIARRLGESKFSAPHFYLTMVIDMDNTISFRKQVNNQLDGKKISYNDIVIKACAMALKQHPEVNSSWLGDKIRTNYHINIGVAVAVDEGLLVPVLNHADKMSMTIINDTVKELAEKARNKKLQPDEMQGNTFTISNLGMYGIDEFTAIINPPDACILAVGGITELPVVKDGEIVIGNQMKITLSCDHRVVDGATGSEFLITLKSFLENPLSMLV